MENHWPRWPATWRRRGWTVNGRASGTQTASLGLAGTLQAVHHGIPSPGRVARADRHRDAGHLAGGARRAARAQDRFDGRVPHQGGPDILERARSARPREDGRGYGRALSGRHRAHGPGTGHREDLPQEQLRPAVRPGRSHRGRHVQPRGHRRAGGHPGDHGPAARREIRAAERHLGLPRPPSTARTRSSSTCSRPSQWTRTSSSWGRLGAWRSPPRTCMLRW